MPRQQVAKFLLHNGYIADLPLSVDRLGYTSGYIRQGSRNVMTTGAGLILPFRGFTKVESISGSRLNVLTDNGFAGLGDGVTNGFGSIFKAINLLFFMGGGPLAVNGTPIMDGVDPVLGSSTFQYLVRHNGIFDTGDSTHRYDVGHAQPSAPNVYAKTPVSGGQKPMNAVVDIAIWRADSLTGQPSRPSDSVEVTLTNASIIVQFPDADDNGQDVWGIGGTLLGVQIGNVYEIPISQRGEVLESVLAYNRTVTAAVASGSPNIVLDAGTTSDNRFSSNDIGRRFESPGKMDSWIISVTDAFNAVANDNATVSGTSPACVVTHAVDGYTRAIEISYSDDDLLATATLAPYYAFEPPQGRFCGFILDTFFVEDEQGTIFYSLPNYLSFPKLDRKIFTDDRATLYLDTGWGYQWRLAPQSISQLYYIPGDAPINLKIKAKNMGCKYPANACLGYGGRLMIWTGRPTIMAPDGSLDSTVHTLVNSEFDGWEDQSENEPVVAAYDPIGQYELWCKGNKIMAVHAPSGRWCSPIYLDQWSNGTIVGQVIVDERLRLVVKETATLVHFKWNVGTGSDMVIETFQKEMPGSATITEVQAVVKAGTTDLNMVYTLIADFDREILVGSDVVKASDSAVQTARSFRPDVRGVRVLGMKVFCAGANGNAAIEYINCLGEWTETFEDPKSL